MHANDVITLSPRGIIDAFHEELLEEEVLKLTTAAHDKDETIPLDLTFTFNKVANPKTHTILKHKRNAGDIKAQIQEVERKLLLIKEQSANDKKDMEIRLRQAKIDYRNKMIESLGLSTASSSSTTTTMPRRQSIGQHKENEYKLCKLQREMKSLKKANARLRRAISSLRRRMDDLRDSNKQLEKSFRQAEDRCAELIEHIMGMEESKEKLEAQCETAKTELKKMRRDYFRRRSYHKAEAKCCTSYDKCLTKILARARKPRPNASLYSDIFHGMQHVRAHALRIRAMELEPLGLAVPAPSSTRRKKNKTTFDDLDDSDSDSDDSDDSDDEDVFDDSDTDSEWDSDSSASESSSSDDEDDCQQEVTDSSFSSCRDDEDVCFYYKKQ